MHLRMVDAQVRLAGKEIVQVVLSTRGISLPCGAAKYRQPIVRRRAVLLGVGPYIPFGLRRRAAGATDGEPRMQVGGVVQDLVDDHPQAESVGRGDQGAKIV